MLKKIHGFIFGTSVNVTLPPHVKEAIRYQQLTSEKLISWVQLTIVAIFSLLYLVAPKTAPATATFSLVPWALIIYFCFSFIRLWLSYRENIPTWFLYCSIFTDILLLMSLVWSFHLEYHQPAAFYLKAPTLLYVFIFIALRVLHFEAKYVLTTGLTAIVGWLTLVGLAICDSESPPGVITRNYVLYMTSNHILIGGEIDKIISILMVTIILTIAVRRGQHLLEQSVAETIATDELSKFFIPEIARTIIQSGKQIRPGYGESCKVAILHCDIRNFTQISKELTPNELMRLLTEYQSKMVTIIRDNSGRVDKYIGDGILASYNAIAKSERYAADAIQTALDIITANNAWAAEREKQGLFPIRIGVSVTAGEAILGIVGSKTRYEYTLIGDPVNLAVKLDKYCKEISCSAIATETAFKLAIEQGFSHPENYKTRKECKVAGVTGLQNLVILV